MSSTMTEQLVERIVLGSAAFRCLKEIGTLLQDDERAWGNSTLREIIKELIAEGWGSLDSDDHFTYEGPTSL